MGRTGAAFSVRFLRNGDQITIQRDIVNEAGDGAALFQVVDPNSGTVSPDWSIAANQPIIRLGARSSAGFPVEVTGVSWAYDGTTLNFAYNGSSWVTASNDSRFKARINGTKYELRVCANLASSSVVSNKLISYELSYISNAMTGAVQGDVDVLIQAAGSDSHILQITTNRVELDATNTTATLRVVGQYGTKAVTIGSDGYTIEWYQDEMLLSETSATLTVTRDMVTGGSLFIAKLKKNGSVVAQDSQRINDIADEWQVQYTPTNAGSNYCAIGHNATYTLSLTRNGVAYTGAVTYSWKLYDAMGSLKRSGSGATVTVQPSDCEISADVYGDCDVTVDADF